MIVASDKLKKNPDVSVFIITYNQQETISQTIESILSQKGNFSLELVIGEDCGNDNTRNICKAYQQKYPETIKLLLQDENKGLLINYIDTIRLCNGKFIGVCAGDDYWIDDYKIEKQLQFFNKNPDFGVVTTGGYRLLVKKNRLVEGIAPFHPKADGYVFDQSWREGVYAMPLSLLFRSELLQYIDFDEFIRRKFSVEDVPMQAILAKHTRFGHIPDYCVVYRVYNTSLTFINLDNPKYLFYHQGLVEIRRYLNELYPEEVEFSEQWANDYMAYRRFLVAVYRFRFAQARHELSKLQHIGTKEQRAIRYSSNLFKFYFFCVAKHYKLKQSNKVHK